MKDNLKDGKYIKDEFNKKIQCIDEFINGYKSFHKNFVLYDDDSIKKFTFDDILNYVTWLSDQIKDKNYIGIYGIPRGGLLFAILLSYKTGIPLLQTAIGNCLVIEDVVNTSSSLIPYYKRFDTACMCCMKDSPIKPTYYIEYDEVVYFPWNNWRN